MTISASNYVLNYNTEMGMCLVWFVVAIGKIILFFTSMSKSKIANAI